MEGEDQFLGGLYSNRDFAYVLPNNILNFGKGSVNKGILVVSVQRSDGGDDRAFLEKILGAAGMDLSKDVYWASVDADTGAFIATPVHLKQWNRVLVFGLLPASLGIGTEHIVYKPVEFNGSTWLFADSLPTLEQNPVLKKKLWAALQAFFGIAR